MNIIRDTCCLGCPKRCGLIFGLIILVFFLFSGSIVMLLFGTISKGEYDRTDYTSPQSQYVETSCTMFVPFIGQDQEELTWRIIFNVSFEYDGITVWGRLSRVEEYSTSDEAQQAAAVTEVGSIETCYYIPPVNVESTNNYLYSIHKNSENYSPTSESEYLGLLISGSLALAGAVGITVFLLAKACKGFCTGTRRINETLSNRNDAAFTPNETLTTKQTTFTAQEEETLENAKSNFPPPTTTSYTPQI